MACAKQARDSIGIEYKADGRTHDSKPQKPVDYDELHMLDDETLALIVARAQLVNKITERGGHEIANLEARLNTLQETGIPFRPSVLTPGHLADWFHDSINQMQLPKEVRRHMMDVFGDYGIELMLDFYRGANQVLIEHGIMPDMKITNVKISHNHAPKSPTQMLHRRLEQLDDIFSHLPVANWQAGLLESVIRKGEPEDTNTYEQKQQKHTKATSVKLSASQVQSIDHVEAVFREMLGNELISKRMREELQRLIVPLVYIRLSGDPDTFVDHDSPVRVFVRQLAILGQRDNEEPLHEFENIRSLIGRIVSEHGQDMDSFRSGADALFTLTRNEVKRRMNESTANLMAQATKDATAQVTIELNEHAAGLNLPESVQRFIVRLLGPWMIVRHVRYGESSPQWEQAREFAATFFDALRPATTEKGQLRKRALRRLSMQEAKTRTERSKMPPDEAQELLYGIEQHFNYLNQMPLPSPTTSSHPQSGSNIVVQEVLGSPIPPS